MAASDLIVAFLKDETKNKTERLKILDEARIAIAPKGSGRGGLDFSALPAREARVMSRFVEAYLLHRSGAVSPERKVKTRFRFPSDLRPDTIQDNLVSASNAAAILRVKVHVLDRFRKVLGMPAGTCFLPFKGQFPTGRGRVPKFAYNPRAVAAWMLDPQRQDAQGS